MGSNYSKICSCSDDKSITDLVVYQSSNTDKSDIMANGKQSQIGMPYLSPENNIIINSKRSSAFKELSARNKSEKDLNELNIDDNTVLNSKLSLRQECEELLYEGSLINELYHGNGKLTENNFIYIGEFEYGKKHGKGKVYYLNNNKLLYEGEFRNDKKEGIGIEYSDDGSEYTGAFKDNLRNGRGSLKNSNGTYFEGEFCNGIIKGQGSLYWNPNKYYNGEFLNGKLHGYGKFTQNDIIYRGNYENSKKQGTGHIIYLSKKINIIGNFNDDNLNGLALLINDDRSEKLLFFNNGIPDTSHDSELDSDKNKEVVKKFRTFFSIYQPKSSIESNYNTDITVNKLITFK